MKKSAFQFFLVVSFTFFSCRNEPVEEPSIRKVQFDLTDFETISCLDFIERGQVIVLELTKNSAIDNVDKIVMRNDRIFVMNFIESSGFKYLLAFDGDGKFEWVREASFDGPGNFYGYKDFILSPDDHIEILDGGQSKIVRYDFQGAFVNETPMDTDAHKIAKFTDGTYAYNRNNSYLFGRQKEESNLLFINQKGERMGSGHIRIDPLFRDLAFTVECFFPGLKEDEYFATHPINDTVYHCAGSGVKPLFVIDYKEKAVKGKMLNDLRQELEKKAQRDQYNLVVLNFLNDPSFISHFDIVVERERYFWLSFTANKKRYYLSVDKFSDASKLFAMKEDCLNHTSIFILDENHFALVVDNPGDLQNRLRKISPETERKLSHEIGEDPNPLIIKLDLDLIPL